MYQKNRSFIIPCLCFFCGKFSKLCSQKQQSNQTESNIVLVIRIPLTQPCPLYCMIYSCTEQLRMLANVSVKIVSFRNKFYFVHMILRNTFLNFCQEKKVSPLNVCTIIRGSESCAAVRVFCFVFLGFDFSPLMICCWAGQLGRLGWGVMGRRGKGSSGVDRDGGGAGANLRHFTGPVFRQLRRAHHTLPYPFSFMSFQ